MLQFANNIRQSFIRIPHLW